MLHRFALLMFWLALMTSNSSLADDKETGYTIRYEVKIEEGQQQAAVNIKLSGPQLPSKLVLHIDPERHLDFSTPAGLQRKKNQIIWQPKGSKASISYRYIIDNQKSSGRYDSRITPEWAILRSDKLIPPISATAPRQLSSRATMTFSLPKKWSSAAPYESMANNKNSYRVIDPGRRFKRPKGWLMLGKFASRQDIIGKTDVRVAAPAGSGTRLQDTLAFISWNLPELTRLFPDFPEHLLVVMAGKPMWLGGLSGTRSLFMHSSRPLISGNRTSSLIHELVHVGTGIRGDKESDWVVEGLAEFYAIEILRRSGGISQRRFEQSMEKLHQWGRQAPSLLVKRSSGAVSARAASLMYELDQTIQKQSEGQRSLDDVARDLADHNGTVSVAMFTRLAEKAAGSHLPQLRRKALGDTD